ncbi:MAG: permease-like cell division protein FtsX [Burkholderiaceae bacterium]|nr:permease-like cell division protein FtsX [Burkholderiaceae bacterium]
MSFLSSRIWAAKQVCRGINNAKGLFFLALMLASLTLTIPVFIASAIYSLSEPLRAVPVVPQITVFSEQNITKAEMDNLLARIKRHEHVMDAELISKEKAYEDLNANLGIKKGKSDKNANPLPDLVIVTLSHEMAQSEIEKTATSIEKLHGVDLIAYDSTWVAKLEAISQGISTLAIIMGAITLSLLVLVVAASVRLAADAQKTELSMLYLFGASSSFTIRPYAWRGVLTMGLAALISIGLSKLALDSFNQALSAIAQQYGTTISVSLLPWEYNVGFVLFCATLGGLIASIITQRAIARIEKHR